MVALYVGGQGVAWSDAERVLGDPSVFAHRVELRNEAGVVVARFVAEPPEADKPVWVKAITPEETARRRAGSGV